MKATIEVKSKHEADAIREALLDPELRAQAVVLGTLRPLSPTVRKRVTQFILDRLNEAV